MADRGAGRLMGDGVDIRHGGAIEVDPDAVRAVADGMAAAAVRLSDAAAGVREATRRLWSIPDAAARVDVGSLHAAADQIDALHGECATAIGSTRLMADVYELVERRQQLAAMEIQTPASIAALQARIDALVASDERVVEMETWLLASWEKDRYAGLDSQFDLDEFFIGPGPGVLFAASRMIGNRSAALPPGARLQGKAGPVSVAAVKTSTPIVAAAPHSIADALRRMPDAPGAQIKVERYEMPDGTKRFVLYEKGTQALLGITEPFDMISNVALFSAVEADSYAATVEALRLSGARPGDRVDVVAHSQAAMNAAYLSTADEFDVKVQITAGSPVHPTLDEDQLLIELRHTDDPVSALAGGGLPGGSGSPDSIVASRIADPRAHLHDLWLHPHLLDTYIETAEMVDASEDVRLHTLQLDWAQLNTAESVVVTEYEAKRG